MEATLEWFAKADQSIERVGSDRGYRGQIKGAKGVEVAFLSASEIAQQLRDGKIDAGVTGEDLLRETFPANDESVRVLARLEFGYADVVVAVPECWLDCDSMVDLDDISQQFHAQHSRRIRVATKYRNLTRRFFAQHGVTGYRIIESLGATEGAPAAGMADVIVDITTSGNTLRANHLKILSDGVILKSCAVLAAHQHSHAAEKLKGLIDPKRLQPMR